MNTEVQTNPNCTCQTNNETSPCAENLPNDYKCCNVDKEAKHTVVNIHTLHTFFRDRSFAIRAKYLSNTRRTTPRFLPYPPPLPWLHDSRHSPCHESSEPLGLRPNRDRTLSASTANIGIAPQHDTLTMGVLTRRFPTRRKTNVLRSRIGQSKPRPAMVG